MVERAMHYPLGYQLGSTIGKSPDLHARGDGFDSLMERMSKHYFPHSVGPQARASNPVVRDNVTNDMPNNVCGREQGHLDDK